MAGFWANHFAIVPNRDIPGELPDVALRALKRFRALTGYGKFQALSGGLETLVQGIEDKILARGDQDGDVERTVRTKAPLRHPPSLRPSRSIPDGLSEPIIRRVR